MEILKRKNIIRYVSENVNALDWGSNQDNKDVIRLFEYVEKLGNKVSDCDLERILENVPYEEIMNYLNEVDEDYNGNAF